jgi:hypothetical protein
MDKQIVLVYCLCDDVLRALNHYEDAQRQMSDAEVLTTAIVAALYFGGNIEKARILLSDHGYVPAMLGKSRLNRRLHECSHYLEALFAFLAEAWKTLNECKLYVIDSFPVKACENCRIPRCRLYRDEQFRGYQASKRRYFYGVKIHLMVTAEGQPVEFFLTPGCVSDTRALRMYRFDLPEQADIIGDKAYNDYEFEDSLKDCNMNLKPLRKDNSKRKIAAWSTYLRASARKTIETTGSLIERLLPKHIHAVTAAGFEIKAYYPNLRLDIQRIRLSSCLWF